MRSVGISFVVVSISASLALGCGGGGSSGGGGGVTPPGVASRLEFDDQPQDVDAGDTLPPITVRIEDSAGNLIVTATNTVTIVADHPTGVTLGGDTTRSAVGGIATFDDLTLSQVGRDVTLTASASGLTQDESEAFDVDVPAGTVPGGQGRIFAVNTAGRLLTFDAANVIEPRSNVLITGSADPIIAIDFRPATGELIGLSDDLDLYQINTSSGVATRIGATSLTGLTGAGVGVDFNPLVDRLRVVTDDDDNVRVNPGDATQVVDTDLAFTAGDPNVGDDPQVAAIAYTNPNPGATVTTLYGIDALNDVLVVLASPNGGQLATVGPLGVNTSVDAALDIVGGSTAFAMLDVAGVRELHRIDLDDGAATRLGTFADQTILDIAIEAPTVVAAVNGADRSALVTFGAAAPGTLLSAVRITGLQASETIVGIDYRPATSQLYALGSSSRLYQLNPTSGAATSVGTLSVTLSGAAFGVDFDATTDRLIVVSDTGQNLSVHPTTAVATAGTTIFAGADVIGLAGTPNVPGAATSFLGLDAAGDELVLVNTTTGAVSGLGALGVNVSTASLDESQLGVTYAVINGALRTIELDGAASLIGSVGTSLAIGGMAIPTVARARVFVVDQVNGISELDLGSGAVRLSGTVSGLGAETLRGIDFRPSTSVLYGLGVDGTTASLYTIDTTTFAATKVGPSFAVTGAVFGFDFNPVADRIRVVSESGENFRLNPIDGAKIDDTGLNPGSPSVTGVAYTNSVTPVPASTTLYLIDSDADQLMTTASPNGGTLTAVGSLGLATNSLVSFDISARGVGLAVLDEGSGPALYSINLTSGAATLLYSFSTATRGLAIAP